MKNIYLILLVLITIPQLSLAKVNNILPGLEKTGVGTVKYMGIFKVYDAELYTPPELQSTAILDEETSRCLVLHYDLDLSAGDIIKGANAVLRRQHSQEILDKTSKYIETLHNNYTSVQSGDSYTLCYDATTNKTRLLFNDEEVVSIDSTEFARIYFGIWLGSKEPISDSLRDNLLAQLAGKR
jgi:hypothetical protein